MVGLVRKEVLAYYRRMSRVSFAFDLVIALGLVFLMRSVYSMITLALLVMPINMSSSPTTFKEMDTEGVEGRYTLTLPYCWKDLVLGRFLAGLWDGAMQAGLFLAFTMLHYFTVHSLPFSGYVQLWLAGVLLGLLMLSINMAVSFIAEITGTVVFYLCSIGLAMGGVVLSMLAGVDLITFLTQPPALLWAAAILLVAVVGAASYLLSIHALERSRSQARRKLARSLHKK